MTLQGEHEGWRQATDSLENVPMAKDYFEPQFYEDAAALHLAEALDQPVMRNVRVPIFGRAQSSWPEIDGIVRSKTTPYSLVEIKSYPITETDVRTITTKCRSNADASVIVIAPRSTSEALQTARALNVALLEFKPDLSAFARYYTESFTRQVPEFARRELENGAHHFRYLMPTRAPHRQKRFINQVDKRIRTVEALARDIVERLPEPPIRVFWSVAGYRRPKWVYRGGEAPLEKRFIAIDIDGTLIHRPFFPCYVAPSFRACPACEWFARRTAAALADTVPASIAVWSGKKGVHLYLTGEFEDSPEWRRRLLRLGIRPDWSAQQSPNPVIGFPGSVHGSTGRQLEVIELDHAEPAVDLPHFRDYVYADNSSTHR